MASGKDNLIQEYRNWVLVLIPIDNGGRQLCCDVLFDKENRLTDRVQLHKRIEPEQSRTCWFKNLREALCPSIEITNHNDFDMPLLTRILEVICGSEYKSLLVKDMRNLRNE